MKSVLFVCDSLSVGGLEKSLINLLNNFNYDKYSVDLYLFNTSGYLVNRVNSNVNILPSSPYFSDFYCETLIKSMIKLIRKRQFNLVFLRILWFLKPRFYKLLHIEYKPDTVMDWYIKMKTMLKIDKHYDIAIGYAEGTAIHYIVDCIYSTKKLGWIHTDISALKNGSLEQKMLRRLDYLVTVSENSKSSILRFYPEMVGNVRVLPNLIDTGEIEILSKEIPEHMDLSTDVLKIVSVGRLVELKGFHLCVKACAKLIADCVNVKWYVVGDGDYRGIIKAEIERYKMEDNFFLVGATSNPYCYMANADICVQPSRYEGKSVVVEEEKYLRKLIVASDIGAFREVIIDGKTGILIERSPEGIYKGIKRLLDNPSEGETIRKNITNDFTSNNEIIAAIEALMEKEETSIQ